MLTIRTLAAVGIGFLITSATGSVFATPFAPVLDEFWIMKGSAAAAPIEIFRDSFNDNIAPPSGPDGATTYSLAGSGGITSEAAGKLTMTPSFGTPFQLTGVVADLATVALRNLATNTNTANNTLNFLGAGSSFGIHGLYDMSNLPMGSGQIFGIRAIDRAIGIGNLGNDTYDLFVFVNGITGDTGVGLRHEDFTTNVSTFIGGISIQSLLTGADQIELIFSKALGASELTASYILYDYDLTNPILASGFVGGGTTLSIYDGETYIRASFLSTDRVLVPEPATLALFGLGFAGVALMRRRRTPA